MYKRRFMWEAQLYTHPSHTHNTSPVIILITYCAMLRYIGPHAVYHIYYRNLGCA